MVFELVPFSFTLDSATLAGIGLWSLALYLGFSPVGDWMILQLQRWFDRAERSLYLSQEEYDRTRDVRTSVNSLSASLFSVVPFLMVGILCNYGVEMGLGRSWAVSMGLLACMSCGIYELGRRSSETLKD
ncbi:hypothetical protein [Prochlorothrix hollandica]|uniref:hypothetical protein n=1 Tax=Prochlorothrix hollandica TaxID=1223 RepID=UPI003340179C